MHDILTPFISVCVASICAISGVSSYLEKNDLDKLRNQPGFYLSVEDGSNPSGQDVQINK